MAALTNKTVYVVDDDAVHLGMMAFMLRRMGFGHVEAFPDVDAALAALADTAPDLIISDWNMEPMDGLEFLTAVRSHKAWRDIPFVMVTANTSQHYWRDAIAAGVSEFLFKPMKFAQLKDAVLIALGLEDKEPHIAKLRRTYDQSRIGRRPVGGNAQVTRS